MKAISTILAVLLIVSSTLTAIVVHSVSTSSSSSASSCAASDANLLNLQAILCRSITGTSMNSCCQTPLVNNVTSHGDWPKQATYMVNLWNALMAPTTCLGTATAANVVNWLSQNYSNPNQTCSYMWTWEVFQFQYYDTPRKPGDRIESAYTLGMKCWAFAALMDAWQPRKMNAFLSQYNLSLGNFEAQVNAAIPQSFYLCNKVAANCFVNKSFDPVRNGTCPFSIAEFKVGFEYQNLRCGENLKDPYWLNGK